MKEPDSKIEKNVTISRRGREIVREMERENRERERETERERERERETEGPRTIYIVSP